MTPLRLKTRCTETLGVITVDTPAGGPFVAASAVTVHGTRTILKLVQYTSEEDARAGHAALVVEYGGPYVLAAGP